MAQFEAECWLYITGTVALFRTEWWLSFAGHLAQQSAEYSVDGEKLMRCIHTYILDDPDMFENDMNDIRRGIKKIFTDRNFTKSVEESGKDNWLRIKASVAFERILECLEGLN